MIVQRFLRTVWIMRGIGVSDVVVRQSRVGMVWLRLRRVGGEMVVVRAVRGVSG